MVSHRRNIRIRLPRKVRACCAATVLAVIVTGIALTPEQAMGQGDSLLRAVDVSMTGDGTMTAVKATSITTKSDQSTNSSSDGYSPSEVAGELPVRIVTSYRTEDSAGSDLSELNGYSGRVVIDIEVENLTLRSQELSYDLDGSSHSTSALVGAPMTVVASASLEGTGAGDVIVDGADEETNGLVSVDSGGKTQVQWGSLIAPPMLPATTDLRLVVDASNFSSPDVNISVRPGLATDSSASTLLDASSQMKAQMDLEERTIAVATQVNEVLAQTSSTIQDVRSSLDSSAGTIGTQTLSDMQASAQNLTGSMSSVGSQLDSLKGDLQNASAQSSSQTLTQLQSSVEAMSALLGDTGTTSSSTSSGSASPGSPASGAVPGATGQASSTASDSGQPSATESPAASDPASPDSGGTDPASSGTSVYATVQNIAAQLEAYADAGDEQRKELNASLSAAIGPADPGEGNCQPGATTSQATGSSASSTPEESSSPQTSQSTAATSPSPTGTGSATGAQADPDRKDASGDSASPEASASSAAPSEEPGTGAQTQQLSATCALYQGQQSFNKVLEDFTSQAESLLTVAADASGQAGSVTSEAANADAQARTVLEDVEKLASSQGTDTDGLGTAISELGARRDGLAQAVATARTAAVDGQRYNDTTVAAQVQAAVTRICTDRPADLNELLPLLSTKDCAGAPLPGDAQTTSVEALLGVESGKWKALSEALDTSQTTDAGGLGSALAAYDSAYAALQSAYNGISQPAGGDEPSAGATSSAASPSSPASSGTATPSGQASSSAGATGAQDPSASASASTTAPAATPGSSTGTGGQADADSLEELRQAAQTLTETTGRLSSAASELNGKVGQLGELKGALSSAEATAQNSMKEAMSGANGAIRQVSAAGDAAASQDLFGQSALRQSAQQMTEQAASTIDAQQQELANGYTRTQQSMDAATQEAQEAVAASIDGSAADLTGANALLGDDMAKLLADIGDPDVAGSGLLGSLGKNAALADSADSQLAVASSTMAGYANVRSTDLGGLMLRQAQMSASLERLDELSLFKMRKPHRGTTNSVYVFSIKGSR